MNQERDKFLTEAMGECWHEKKPVLVPQCIKCFKTDYKQNNFSTWEGFGKLWEWSQKQVWWENFLLEVNNGTGSFYIHLVHPDKFADSIYQYLKGEE